MTDQSDAEQADVGDAIGLRTKENVIYIGEVVEYDPPLYAPPDHSLMFGVEIESAHRVTPDGLEPAPGEIPSEPPNEFDAPDGFDDGVVSLFDFGGRSVLLEWSAAFRPDSMMFAPRPSAVVDRFVSDDMITPERLLSAAERNEWGVGP